MLGSRQNGEVSDRPGPVPIAAPRDRVALVATDNGDARGDFGEAALAELVLGDTRKQAADLRRRDNLYLGIHRRSGKVLTWVREQCGAEDLDDRRKSRNDAVG
jgi:hypothetical protein